MYYLSPHTDAQQNFQIFWVGLSSRSIKPHFVPCCKKSKNINIFLSMSSKYVNLDKYQYGSCSKNSFIFAQNSPKIIVNFFKEKDIKLKFAKQALFFYFVLCWCSVKKSFKNGKFSKCQVWMRECMACQDLKFAKV